MARSSEGLTDLRAGYPERSGPSPPVQAERVDLNRRQGLFMVFSGRWQPQRLACKVEEVVAAEHFVLRPQ